MFIDHNLLHMEKTPGVSFVNEMIMQVITEPAGGEPPSQEEKEKVKREADKLPYHWLRSVRKKITKVSLNYLVQLAQKTTVWLLNRIYNAARAHKALDEDDLGYHDHLEGSLVRFLRYLERNFKKQFDFNSTMPKCMWVPILKRIRQTIIPNENSCLKEVDEALVALLNRECRSMLGKRAPSFAKGYYWGKLSAILNKTIRVNDATLQTIYTLISCNFNSDAFAKYVTVYYGKELEPGEDATDFWRAHLVELGRIYLRHEMVLNPELPFSCIEMLIASINNEIQAFAYTSNANRLIAAPISLRTTLSIPLLGLFYRLQVDTEILDEANKSELMKKVALLYQTPGGSLSHEHLYGKYYKIEQHTINTMRDYLSRMINRLRDLENGRP